MSLVEAEEVPDARSFCSTSSTRSPRPAASRAIPAPLIPPPMMARSKSVMPFDSPLRQHGAREPSGSSWNMDVCPLFPPLPSPGKAALPNSRKTLMSDQPAATAIQQALAERFGEEIPVDASLSGLEAL